MKKITLILVALTLSMGLFSQSKMKKGIEVGDKSAQPNVTTIDSMVTEDGMIAPYVGGVKEGVYNDSIEVLIDALTAALIRVVRLEDSILGVTPAGLILDYKFDNNLLDETDNNNDGTEVGQLLYDTPDGSDRFGTMASMFGGVSSVYTPTVELTNTFNIGIDFSFASTNEPQRRLFESEGNFYANVNPTDSSFQFVTFSSPTDSSVLTTGPNAFDIKQGLPYTVHRFDAYVNTATGMGEIYIDGVGKSATGGVKVGITTSVVIYIGANADGDFPVYAALDNFKIITGTSSADEIASRYASNEYYQIMTDVTPPVLQSGVVENLSPGILTLVFNEDIHPTDTSSVRANLDYEADNVNVAIDSIRILDKHILCYTADVLWDDVLTVTYTASDDGQGIQDISGNELATISEDSGITNELCDYIQYTRYQMEQNGVDGVSGLTADYTGSSPFSNNVTYAIDGYYFQNVGVGGATFTIPSSFDPGSKFTLGMWARINGQSIKHVIASNMAAGGADGWELYINPDDKLVYAAYANGVVDSIYSVTDATENDWMQIFVEIDKPNGKGLLFIDGDKNTADSSIHTSFTTAGSFTISQSGNNAGLGRWDEVMSFTNWLPPDSITYMYNNIGHMYNGCGDENIVYPDPEAYGTYADTIVTIFFDNVPTTAQLTEAQNEAALLGISGVTYDGYTRGLFDSQSPANDCNASIIDYGSVSNGDASRVMKLEVKAGKSGLVGVQDDGGGIKTILKLPIGLTDLYCSVNVLWMPGTDFQWNGKYGVFLNTGENSGDSFPREFRSNYNFFGTDSRSTYPYVGGSEFYANYWWFDKAHNVGGFWLDTDGVGNWAFDVSAPVWVNITTRVSLNDEGDDNGVMEAFINGVLVASTTGDFMQGDMYLDRMNFQYWYGGIDTYNDDGDPVQVWSPQTDQWILVDDIYVFNYKASEGMPGPHEQSLPGSKLPKLPGWNLNTNTKVER